MDQVLEITSNDHIIMIDKLCKRILGHPETLGRITKGFVKEAKDVSLEEAVTRAVDECIEEGILAEFLLKNKTEVIKVSIYEYDKEFEEEIVFQLVGSTEANSLAGKISNESPVGKALIGKKVGDVVAVETQAGVIEYEVLKINRSV